MKLTLGVCLLVLTTAVTVAAQDPTKPVLRPGIRVQMSTVSQAVEVPEADAENAIVVVITKVGKLFLGTQPVETSALRDLKAGTVYVKVDARAPFQNVLTVLDALHGKSVILLTAPLSHPAKDKMMAPFGVRVRLGE